jgi:hypothetical protein
MKSMIPDYFTYFFREGQERFQSIYELDDEEIERIVNGETWREDGTYIAFRKQLEQRMRTQFLEKGGVPQRHHPIYMILGDSPQSPHDLHKNYAHKLVIPRTIFSDTDVSFTYPDSVFHLPVDDVGRVYLEQNPTPTVYLNDDLDHVIDIYRVDEYNNLKVARNLGRRPFSPATQGFQSM